MVFVGLKYVCLKKLFAVVSILPVGREAEIGLPPRLTSFRYIFSESVCSANEVSAKKGFFGLKTPFLDLVGFFRSYMVHL